MRAAAILASVAVSVTTLSVSNVEAAPAATQIYWGSSIDGSAFGFGSVPHDMRAVQAFEAQAGKGMSIIAFGGSWMDGLGNFEGFTTSNFDNVRAHGAIPLFTWQSRGPTAANFRNAIVTSGRYDTYIHSWARSAKAWGHPFFLRFDQEMDGSWFPWGEGRQTPTSPIANGNTPGSFVLMWRHVHDIFTAEGVTNVTWVWNPNQENLIGRYPPMSQIYPGDAYVDWTGIDAYNRFPDHWQTFAAMITGVNNPLLEPTANTYQLVLNVAPNKPMLMGEFASSEDPANPNHKASWFRDAFLTQIVNKFTAIRGIVYFNDGRFGDPTLPINSSAASRTAFANSIASSAYVNNRFSALPAGRIGLPAGSVTYLNPVADTYVTSDAPTSTHGASTTLQVKGTTTATRKAYFRFDLTSLAGRTIDQAVLQVSTANVANAQSSGTFNVKFDANTTWSEATMSWNNQGSAFDLASTVSGRVVSPNLVGTPYVAVLPVTLVTQHRGGLLSLEMDTSASDGIVIASREASSATTRPQLIIAYH